MTKSGKENQKHDQDHNPLEKFACLIGAFSVRAALFF